MTMTNHAEGAGLLELAELCEKAEGPSYALEQAIGRAVRCPTVVPPIYTASLDAAMSLVPEGWGWLVSQPNAKAIASGLLKERTPVLGEVQYGCDLRFAVAAATPALALTAACLRARAASGEK